MDLLRLVVVGSVDDGKSTLVGRLLLDTDSLLVDQWDALTTATQRRGGSGVDLSLITDGLRAERDQAITIDVAYRRFSTPTRVFLVADCPGHVEYTRNTVTGASTADAALVLVDATKGVREQTRRHTAILGLLRVPQVVFVLNKMDAVGWDAAVVASLTKQLSTLATATGVHAETVPVSALTGEGVATLLQHLDRLQPASTRDRAMRFPVQWVIPSPAGPLLAGRLASGRLRVGDTVSDGDQQYRVAALQRASSLPTDASRQDAVAGDSISVLLSQDEALDQSVSRNQPGRGVLLAPPDALPFRTDRLRATVCWLSAEAPASELLLKAGTATVSACVTSTNATWDVTTLEWSSPRPLQLNDLAEVDLSLATPVSVDLYANNRTTGAFLLIDPISGTTVAAGMVTEKPSSCPARSDSVPV